MSLVYLKWSFLLLVVWGVLYASDAAGRRSLLTLSLGTVPFSLTEPLFVPSYWNPPTLFDLARRTGFDIESVIFALDRKSTRLNSSHYSRSRMPSSA